MNNISNRSDSNYPPMSDSEWVIQFLKLKNFLKDIDYWIQECGQLCNDDTYIEEA